MTLDTAGAASFTFVANDVPVGDHTITAQARVVTSAVRGVFRENPATRQEFLDLVTKAPASLL